MKFQENVLKCTSERILENLLISLLKLSLFIEIKCYISYYLIMEIKNGGIF